MLKVGQWSKEVSRMPRLGSRKPCIFVLKKSSNIFYYIKTRTFHIRQQFFSYSMCWRLHQTKRIISVKDVKRVEITNTDSHTSKQCRECLPQRYPAAFAQKQRNHLSTSCPKSVEKFLQQLLQKFTAFSYPSWHGMKIMCFPLKSW